MEYTQAFMKRLALVAKAKTQGNTILNESDLFELGIAVAASYRGSGGEAPSNLDILCISAPAHDLQACQSPAWIPVRCHHGNVTAKEVRCRSCDGCKHSWRSKVRAIILDGCYGSKAFMWTLTIPEYPGKMKGERFDVAQERWHALLRDASKRQIRFQYLRVVELQKRGTPHFHIAVKDVSRGEKGLSDTKVIGRLFRGLSKRAKFGYIEGKTTDFQAARLGGAGVASYMSKYLEKSEDYNALRREDGRAIRRYCRSRGWSNKRPLPVWRYARVEGGFTREYQSTQELKCTCGQRETLSRDAQASKWLIANRREGRWVAPLGVADYLLEKGKVTRGY